MDGPARWTLVHHVSAGGGDGEGDDRPRSGEPLAIGHGFGEVLTAARIGAPWALRCLYEDLEPVVSGYLRLRGADEPEDVASEAFLHVFRRLSGFEGDEAAFRSWVFTIVHRRLIDERRRNGRRPDTAPLEHLPPQVDGDVEEEALDRFEHAWIEDVLSDLSPEQRDVILLRIIADMSVDEVARIVGKRAGAVRALQHRALLRLRRHLSDRSIMQRSSERG
jgi:RNA polymerase sigma factor (sigma-70 family)